MGPQYFFTSFKPVVDIYQILSELGIEYIKYDHEPYFTCEDAVTLKASPDAGECKNLFLRNRKGDKHYLLVIPVNKQVSIKEIEVQIGEKGIGFASPERLAKYLGLTPGSVSPFGLINNMEKDVIVLFDKSLFSFPKLLFHPNINTATLELTTQDVLKFFDWAQNKVINLDVKST